MPYATPKRGRTTPPKGTLKKGLVAGTGPAPTQAPDPERKGVLTHPEDVVPAPSEDPGDAMINEGGPVTREWQPEEAGGDPEEISMVPQQIQGVRVPMPGIPLPLNLFFGLVPLGNQPVILVTAVNDAGSMIQGYFAPELAAKIGRDLVKAARDAEIERSRALITPAKGLILPG